MNSQLSILLLSILLILPANASSDSQDASQDCENNGIIIQIAPESSTFECSGHCQNNGVLIQGSPESTFSCESCENNGIHFFGSGDACQGGSFPGACAGSECTPNCDHRCSMILQAKGARELSDSSLPEICRINIESQYMHCGAAEDCSIIGNPGCWTVRFACGLAFNLTRVESYLNDVNFYCTTWVQNQASVLL
jgi:hypothetical protein